MFSTTTQYNAASSPLAIQIITLIIYYFIGKLKRKKLASLKNSQEIKDDQALYLMSTNSTAEEVAWRKSGGAENTICNDIYSSLYFAHVKYSSVQI